MRSSLKVLIAVAAVSVSVAVGYGFSARPALASQILDCATTTASDSAYLIDFVRRVAIHPDYSAARTFSQIPQSDSVKFSATPEKCDTVSVKYRAHLVAETGDSLWDAVPVLLLRVYPNRYLADPKLTDGNGGHVLVTLDTNLNILKVWKTR